MTPDLVIQQIILLIRTETPIEKMKTTHKLMVCVQSASLDSTLY